MAKDSREMVTRNDIVYIDLGSEDQIKRGDYLTIYRPLGTGNITRVDNEEMARNRVDRFSERSLSRWRLFEPGLARERLRLRL